MNTTPQQPGLRSFIVHDSMPAGCAAYLVTDELNAPHLRPGDVAVIDTADREPTPGELFVIGWTGGSTTIVETRLQALRAGCGADGEMIDTACWMVGGSNRPRNGESLTEWVRAGQPIPWTDGPYATEGPRAGYLRSKLRGRVVGILEPAASEPLRLSSAEGR